MLGVAVVLFALALLLPMHSAIAAQRWLLPHHHSSDWYIFIAIH